MTFDLLVEITALFFGLFALGSLACLPLYDWHLRAFFASKLWIKIYWWWPIYAGLLAVLYGGWLVASILVLLLIIQAGREWLARPNKLRLWPSVYVVLFILSLSQLVSLSLLGRYGIFGLICICFASVLSDVCAFFAGTYVGRHNLPAWINPNKSWEGVLGQIVGAFIGLSLAAATPELNFSWMLALIVGTASAVGDLANSVAKRQLAIKDWIQFIPGHGGVLDRFSSLSFALAAGYVWLLVN